MDFWLNDGSGPMRKVQLRCGKIYKKKTVNVGWQGVAASPPIVFEVRFNRRTDAFREAHPDVVSQVFLSRSEAESVAKKHAGKPYPVEVIAHTSGRFDVCVPAN